MRDSENRARETLCFACTALHRAVKNRTHKLIEYRVPERAPQTRLFDLEHAPRERNDLADDLPTAPRSMPCARNSSACATNGMTRRASGASVSGKGMGSLPTILTC